MTDQANPEETTLSAILHDEADRYKGLLSTRLRCAAGDNGVDADGKPVELPEGADFTTGNDGLALGAALLRFAAVWAHFQERAFAANDLLRTLQAQFAAAHEENKDAKSDNVPA